LILSFMSGIWCGIERYSHLDITRLDENLRRLYGWKRMPEHKAFERYFRKFDIQKSCSIWTSLQLAYGQSEIR
jgi:hypothetical protein